MEVSSGNNSGTYTQPTTPPEILREGMKLVESLSPGIDALGKSVIIDTSHEGYSKRARALGRRVLNYTAAR